MSRDDVRNSPSQRDAKDLARAASVGVECEESSRDRVAEIGHGVRRSSQSPLRIKLARNENKINLKLTHQKDTLES